MGDGRPFFGDAEADGQQGWAEEDSNEAEGQGAADDAEEDQQERHVAALTDEPGFYEVVQCPNPKTPDEHKDSPAR